MMLWSERKRLVNGSHVITAGKSLNLECICIERLNWVFIRWKVHTEILETVNCKFYLKDINYIRTTVYQYLIDCIYEIECNSKMSNSQLSVGVQNRRYKEGLMFSNRQLDFILKIFNPEEWTILLKDITEKQAG